MRVLMINSVCGIRSTGRICTDLALALEKQGHTVKIAYGREAVPEPFSRFAVRIGTDFGVKVHGAKARLLDASGFGSRFATIRFLDWVRAFDPDVIHLHNVHGYYIHVGLLFDYLRTCGKRIIWTLHDCWSFTGHAAYCEGAECLRWETGCKACPKLGEYPKSLTDRSGRNWLKKRRLFREIPRMELVTPSKWLADLTRRSFLSDYPVHVIHNGINLDVFHPADSNTVEHLRQRYSFGTDRILLGVAALWEDRKGLPDLLTLSERLGVGWRLMIVGLSKDQMQSLPDRVVGIARTNSPQELAALYSLADYYVNPTYEDNYPTTNLEAMACGTPVLTYDTGGSGESARLGGVVVPRGDIDALCVAIRRLSSLEALHLPDPALLDYRTAVKAYLALYDGEAL